MYVCIYIYIYIYVCMYAESSATKSVRIRQSGPDSGPSFQAQVRESFEVVSSSLGSVLRMWRLGRYRGTSLIRNSHPSRIIVNP